MRRIKWLTKRDPGAKALVFSSWTDVLDVLSYALRQNDIQFAYAKSASQLGKAIKDLQTRGNGKRSLQTLLLPIKQGANGLNLTGKFPPEV